MKRALAALRLCALCAFVGLSGWSFAGNGPVLDGYSVMLDITGEDVITLSDLVTPGTEMSFQFSGDTDLEPVAWFVNGEQFPLPEDGRYAFDVTTNTTVSLLCKRPIYVSASPNPQVDPVARSYGYSRDNPCRTIQEGVDRALPTAYVNVLTPGVYAPFAATNTLATKVFLFEPEDLGSSTNFPVEVRYVGTNGVASIDGGAARRCVTLSEKAVLRGFTLVNGFADRGAGVFGGSARQCVISNCVASVEGGGACASALHYSLIVRCGVLDAAGWQTGEGGGASRSQLFNCTVSACRAAGGGGVAGGSVANSIVVNSLPDCWLNLTSRVASYNQSTIRFSPVYPYHLDTRFEHLGAAVGSEVLETKDLDGVDLPVTGLNPGCYQTIDDRDLSGVTVNGIDLVYQPFVIWNEETQTATLPATNVELAVSGVNTNLTLCSSGKTPVFFDGFVRLHAISNLTVRGGTLDSRQGWDSVIAGGSICCDNASGFTVANGNPACLSVIEVDVPHGGQVPVWGRDGYNLTSIFSNKGKIYLWGDAAGSLAFVYPEVPRAISVADAP